MDDIINAASTTPSAKPANKEVTVLDWSGTATAAARHPHLRGGPHHFRKVAATILVLALEPCSASNMTTAALLRDFADGSRTVAATFIGKAGDQQKRTHLALDKDAPVSRPVQRTDVVR
jgi:hypothetical protein